MQSIGKSGESSILDSIFKEAEGSQDFDVPNFEVLDVSKKGKTYEVVYSGKRKPRGSQDFDAAKICRKGYEPVDVGEVKQEGRTDYSVVFEKK